MASLAATVLHAVTPSTDTLILAGMGAALYILGRLFFKE